MRTFREAIRQATHKAIDASVRRDSVKALPNVVKKMPQPVYYIKSFDDPTVLVGLGVTVEPVKTATREVFIVRWYDTSRGRAMTASEIISKDGRFAFRRIDQEGGGVYYFTPMNLEIYNSRAKHRLISGVDFTNQEELIAAFLDTVNGGM